MRIKNLTPVSQALTVVEIVGGREFTISVEGNGCTELVGTYIPHLQSLSKVFEVVKEEENHESNTIIEESPEIPKDVEEESPEESEESENPEDVEEESLAATEDGKFICDVCGAEFASARGLASHKNRVHNDKEE